MNSITTFSFENRPLTALHYNGRAAFIANQIGDWFGYDQITKHISQDWADELEEGRDYIVVTGQELSDLKVLLKDNPDFGLSRIARVTLLFESGVNIIALLSRKPEARRLRRFLADEVLPQLARDGRFSTDRTVIDGKLHSKTADREQRLAAREQRLAVKQRADGYKLAIALARRNCPALSSVYEVKTAEVLTGEHMPELLPRTTAGAWKSPSEIGAALGVSSMRVGLVISELWGKERRPIDGVMECRMGKAAHHDGMVPTWFYSDTAVKAIRAHLDEQHTDTDTDGDTDTDTGHRGGLH